MERTTKKPRRGNFESFSEYMNLKENKLRQQFCAPAEGKIFHGVVIHVNGRTEPPIEELRHLVLAHGGGFEQYYSSQRVTHFICTHVAHAKIANFVKRQRGLKVIRPEWIIDSVKQGRMQEEFPYRLYIDEKHAATLDGFVSKDPNEAVEPCRFSQDDVDLLAGLISSENESELDQEELEDFGLEPEMEPGQNFSPQRLDEKDALRESPECGQAQEPSDASIRGPTHIQAKTASDPNFLSDYYKNSRLHHLSTWRESLKTYAAHLMSQRLIQVDNRSISQTYVMHVDLDCFFVSVSLLSQPLEVREQLMNEPIAVCHSNNISPSNAATSSSDISSCNYAARSFGIRNGMYLRVASRMCPHLKLLPYDFEGYNRVSRRFYEALTAQKVLLTLQAVSCDEAFIEVATDDPLGEAIRIRAIIKQACEVDASIGIGSNILLARLATKRAKPAGQYHIADLQAEEYLTDVSVDELPGVGHSLSGRLEAMSIKTCGQLRALSLGQLQAEFGPKIGEALYAKARGQDDRRVHDAANDGSEKGGHRKSVGSEVSWGVRFDSLSQCKRFIDDLAREIWQRLGEAFPGKDLHRDVHPRRLQLKLYRRQKNAPAPHKHLGRGYCDVFHRTRQYPGSFQSESQFIASTWGAFDDFFLKSGVTSVPDIRGIGMFLSDFSVDKPVTGAKHGKGLQSIANLSNWTKPKEPLCADRANATLSEIDPSVLAELPAEIRREFEGPHINAPAVPDAMPPVSRIPAQPTTLTQLWGQRREREAEAHRQAVLALPRDQFDPDVVLQLPIELQKEIVREYEITQRLKSIKPSSPIVKPVEKTKKAPTPGRIVAERLPIEFYGRRDWTGSDLRAFVYLQHRADDFDWAAFEDILVELVMRDCMKPVADCLRTVRMLPRAEAVEVKIKGLVRDLYNSELLL